MTVIRRATLLDLKHVEIVVHAAYSGYITRIGREPGPMVDDYASLIGRGLVHVLDDGGVVGVVVLLPKWIWLLEATEPKSFAVISDEADRLSPTKTPSVDGVRVSGEIMLCRAMLPHPRQFLLPKKES